MVVHVHPGMLQICRDVDHRACRNHEEPIGGHDRSSSSGASSSGSSSASASSASASSTSAATTVTATTATPGEFARALFLVGQHQIRSRGSEGGVGGGLDDDVLAGGVQFVFHLILGLVVVLVELHLMLLLFFLESVGLDRNVPYLFILPCIGHGHGVLGLACLGSLFVFLQEALGLTLVASLPGVLDGPTVVVDDVAWSVLDLRIGEEGEFAAVLLSLLLELVVRFDLLGAVLEGFLEANGHQVVNLGTDVVNGLRFEEGWGFVIIVASSLALVAVDRNSIGTGLVGVRLLRVGRRRRR
mmetsp:Transcript_36162/g.78224  ORF Transcript_36162/g.78224 Transcript_36162/m.78224 type:complete len:300 (+) Transcript_36162:4142-5041(+)